MKQTKDKHGSLKRLALAIWFVAAIFIAGAETDNVDTGLMLTAVSYAQIGAIAILWRKIEKQ